MDKSQSNYSAWKKAEEKKERDEYILYGSIYMKFRECNIEGGKADGDCRGMEWGGGREGMDDKGHQRALEDSERVCYPYCEVHQEKNSNKEDWYLDSSMLPFASAGS